MIFNKTPWQLRKKTTLIIERLVYTVNKKAPLARGLSLFDSLDHFVDDLFGQERGGVPAADNEIFD